MGPTSKKSVGEGIRQDFVDWCSSVHVTGEHAPLVIPQLPYFFLQKYEEIPCKIIGNAKGMDFVLFTFILMFLMSSQKSLTNRKPMRNAECGMAMEVETRIFT